MPPVSEREAVIDRFPAAVPMHDGIRWGPILAGLLTALTTLLVLTVLGLAVGLSAFKAGADASDLGSGAGIWSAVSAIL